MSIEVDGNLYQKLFSNVSSLLTDENNEWPCEVIDISLHGCLLSFNSTWQQHNIEAIYTLTLPVSTSKRIIMNLSVSHVIDNEVSFKCEHIDIEHNLLLHQLVEPNSVASKLLSRTLLELSHPV